MEKTRTQKQKCRWCGKNDQALDPTPGKLGLCWSCYGKPDVRQQRREHIKGDNGHASQAQPAQVVPEAALRLPSTDDDEADMLKDLTTRIKRKTLEEVAAFISQMAAELK